MPTVVRQFLRKPSVPPQWLSLCLFLCVIAADSSAASGASEHDVATTVRQQQLAATGRLIGHSHTNASWLQHAVLAGALLLGIGLGGVHETAAATNAPVDLTLWPGDQCDRPCTADTMPRLCYFRWTLEHFTAMGSACNTDCSVNANHTACLHGPHSPHSPRHPHCLPLDGMPRTIMTINRQLPGPGISVCRGDRIVVDVRNHMHGTATALHWHGMHQRRGHAHMDGVPFVTQCPIAYGTAHRYAFAVREAGTHFYHAHAGHHKSNGLYGALIVRDVPAAAVASGDGWRQQQRPPLYDEDRTEHVVLISDALHALAESLMPGLPGYGIGPDSLLINGRGRWAKRSAIVQQPAQLLAVFHVRHGRRYRFRVINSASHMCLLRLQIEQHRMTVIATDGADVRPLPDIDEMFSSGGERYDFVLAADGRPGGEYWMRVRARGSCASMRLEQFAVVRYAEAGEEEDGQEGDGREATVTREMPAFEEELEMLGQRQLNNPETFSSNPVDERSTAFCITHLQSIAEPDNDLIHGEPDVRLTVTFANRDVDNAKLFEADRYDHFMNIGSDRNLMGTMNNISFGFPSEPPLLQDARQQAAAPAFCNATHLPERCRDLPANYPCICTHVLRVPLGAAVELRIVDDTENPFMSHPFHLHGMSFHVISIASNLNATRAFKAPLRPPPKDTVTVPSDGFVVVRFRADNPGYWLLHCHFEWHMAIGMAALLQVGEPAADVRPPVPLDVPRCGNYQPEPL